MSKQLSMHNVTCTDNDIREEFETFTYMVSHELNAPLRHIKQLARLLTQSLENKLSDKDKRYIQVINSSIERSEDTIERLLEFSRLSTQANPPCATDIKDVLDDAQELLGKQIADCNARLTISPMPTVFGDSRQLVQLFVHLLTNAMKFRQANTSPLIEINASKQGNMWEFTIQDDGIGLDAGKEQYIFELFKSLHRCEQYGGIGMGLAIAKKIVLRHGGDIHARSNPGNGATFTFTLPAHCQTHSTINS